MFNAVTLELFNSPGNPRNSEGSFATLRDGRVMYAYSRYYGDNWADEATARICARYSADNGMSWTTDDVVIVENEGKCNVMSVSLLRLRDGRLALWYIRKDGIDNCHTYLRISDDDAEWGEPICCIPAPGYFVVNNDRVIQLKSGRLLIPASLHRNKLSADMAGDNIYAAFDGRGIAIWFISDDTGVTWRESRDWWALPVRSGSGLQETGTIELADGRLYSYCRTDTGCHYEMFSSDGGDTWTPPAPSIFKAPCSPLSVKRLLNGDLMAVWNDHGGKISPVPADVSFNTNSWGRTPLVCAISRDDGKTWTNHKLLEDDPDRGFCYIAIHPMDDSVLLAYCCGGGTKSAVLQDTCIRKISLDWLYA